MKVLTHAKWTDGYLDYHRRGCEYRVQVIAWRTLGRVEGLYFVRPRSMRLVYNYLREVGGREVLRKVTSRTREGSRNEKYVSCGVGRVLEQGSGKEFSVGHLVVFLAPSHPACAERLVLPAALLLEAPSDLPFEATPGSIYHVSGPLQVASTSWWGPVAGWSAFSGSMLTSDVAHMLGEASTSIKATDWSCARRLPVDAAALVSERRSNTRRSSTDGRKSAVLVGYGNYAKTIILPNVRRYLDVECVHEIDPTQILPGSGGEWAWDSAPTPRDGAHYDAWIIAGYHHTHAPLAVTALDAGSYAIVEKPLATDQCQLDSLERAVRRSPRLFAGFHKRYSPMNDWVHVDLGLTHGDAVSYHCIIYEVPLPERHWYRWPSARSRIVANGCHWIDHFLFLNDYAPVEALDVRHARNGTVSCFVTLANGACFTMVLTDQGAARVGVQEHIELRKGNATVRMTDGNVYHAEDARRVLRRARAHKYSGFRRMYRAIGQAILNGEAGDSPESLIASMQLVLALEDRLRSIRT